MGEDVVTTRVDDLIDYLQGKEKVPLEEVAKALNTKLDIIQSWVDFLVEEGIIGIEYKFTKPYIYLNVKEEEQPKVTEEEQPTWEAYKKAFMQRAREKKIPDEKAASLWQNHVLSALENESKFFEEEARKRGLDPQPLWKQYKQEVT